MHTRTPHAGPHFVGQIAEILFALNLKMPVHIVRYSTMGGGIAAQFAATYPDRCASLVLVASSGVNGVFAKVPIIMVSSITRVVNEMCANQSVTIDHPPPLSHSGRYSDFLHCRGVL